MKKGLVPATAVVALFAAPGMTRAQTLLYSFETLYSNPTNPVPDPLGTLPDGFRPNSGGTITQTGRTLLVPDPAFPFQAEAIAAAGLPELPLIIGKVVFTETVDPVTGAPLSVDITSVNGRVVDVCELLAR